MNDTRECITVNSNLYICSPVSLRLRCPSSFPKAKVSLIQRLSLYRTIVVLFYFNVSLTRAGDMGERFTWCLEE